MTKNTGVYIKRFPLLLSLIVGCLTFSSCFDLVEQIDMNHQGRGTIKATLNLSKSRTKIASLLKMKQFNGINIPSEATIKREMEKVVQTLKSTPEISQVQHHLDFNNYIATLSCQFESVQALNDFSKTLSKQFKVQLTSYNSYQYDQSTRTFSRSYSYTPNLAKEFAKIPGEDKDRFAEAYYTNIIRFNKNIQSQSNQKAKISANNRAVLLKVKVTDLINGSTSLANTIIIVK